MTRDELEARLRPLLEGLAAGDDGALVVAVARWLAGRVPFRRTPPE